MSLFITFEGPEGGGKSTQARLLYQWIQEQGYPVILAREPGGTRIGELIRRILMDLQHTEIDTTTEILLFSAARAQLVGELIRPYLATGGIVLCDRYADSTYAYQGYGLGRDLAELHTITRIATGGLQPDLTFYLDIDARAGLERKAESKRAYETLRKERAQPVAPPGSASAGDSLPPPQQPAAGGPSTPPEWNRLDARDMAYHRRVEEGFRELMQAEPHRWHRIDATRPMEQIAADMQQRVSPLLARVTRLAGG